MFEERTMPGRDRRSAARRVRIVSAPCRGANEPGTLARLARRLSRQLVIRAAACHDRLSGSRAGASLTTAAGPVGACPRSDNGAAAPLDPVADSHAHGAGGKVSQRYRAPAHLLASEHLRALAVDDHGDA